MSQCCSAAFTFYYVPRYYPKHPASKQEKKSELNALHNHTAFVNSELWNLKLQTVLKDGLGSGGMELLNMASDLQLQDGVTS